MTYTKGEVIESKNGTTTVYHPDISDEERARRQDELHKAAARFLRAVERGKNTNEHTGDAG